jgi:hypothetical protein
MFNSTELRYRLAQRRIDALNYAIGIFTKARETCPDSDAAHRIYDNRIASLTGMLWREENVISDYEREE